ncbi:RIO1 family regulatory kinase/ATPase [Ilumatobacter sp.]|uniref:RIO1 family regulatory kinase/ATPase domain-containing protein n=1 Tax=Ilumatobacter sp. TaxID=1967498 RepID=UPI003C624D48
MRSIPTWLVSEPCTDVDLGVIKTGKEAQVNLVQRTGADGTTCQFARKRYLPREVKFKGQLEALGVQRASTFVNDVQYREGRQFRKSRDRRAVAQMSTYGKRLLQDRWTGHEHEIMTRLWKAGLSVPYPIAYGDDVFDLEYIGDDTQAAPQLNAARLTRVELDEAFAQVVAGLRIVIREGFAHGDLSAYNLLWWDDRIWFIDFPQAVDIAANLAGLDFVRRDVVNICGWFQHKGLDVDADDVFDDLLHFM